MFNRDNNFNDEILDLKVKYFDGATELKINPMGNLIDVYANKDVFIPYMAQALIPLGFAMQLPEGHIAKLVPRSSTFKTWGVIQTNHCGIIDETYCGDNDEWMIPFQCTMPKQYVTMLLNGHKVNMSGVWIKQGDKVAQFEIVKATPTSAYKFTVVDKFNTPDRGGFGSTGTK